MNKGGLILEGFSDVGIRTMHDLTKEELIWCMEMLMNYDNNRRIVRQFALLDIADKRRTKKLDKEIERQKRFEKLLDTYIELLKPYNGMLLSDIPMDVLERAAKLEKSMNKLYKTYSATLSMEVRNG